MYRASAIWEDLVYNLARQLGTLRLEVNAPIVAGNLAHLLWPLD
jgi:hypothetical protein